MSKFIITYTPCFRKNMLRELIAVDEKIEVESIFSDSILMIDSKLEKEEFINKLLEKSPIFIKHIMPVMKAGKITENLELDKQEILSSMNSISTLTKEPFAVQCRIISGGKSGLDYSSKDLEVFVGSYYEQKGNIPTFSDTNLKNDNIKVLSIMIHHNDYYLGFSSSKENLNFHCDEYRICGKGGRSISRAENKLKEALSKFNITLDGTGYALDIGAAPGGWTKVLADYGYEVVAVDPGNLKPELESNPKIHHYKCRIEDLDFENFFDIIVNDMNVDPQTTANIMNSLAGSLKENGIAIVTLKLPNKVEEDIKESTQILNQNYDVLTIKSLFHNRQEVTTMIRKKSLILDHISSIYEEPSEQLDNNTAPKVLRKTTK